MAPSWPLLFCLCLLLSLCCVIRCGCPKSGRIRQVSSHNHRDHEHAGRSYYDEPDRHEIMSASPFILDKFLLAVGTEAGEIKVLPGDYRNSILAMNNIGLNFIEMEPKALLLPQYTDAGCVFLVHKGKARLSWVDQRSLEEVELEQGDVYRINGGTVFYLYNPDDGQRLHIFSLFDTSEVLKPGMFQSFFIAGGYDPRSIFSGFEEDVIATALKVSREEVRDVFSGQNRGAIIYSRMNKTKRESQKPVPSAWHFRRTLGKYFPVFAHHPPKPINIAKKSPDYKNNNGRTVILTENDSDMLRKAGVGVFAVSLKAGALMAPHWNPMGTEIALVTNGEGDVQIAFPNGTCALNKRIGMGTVFLVPQYYPMCQIASRNGPFEFMGFTTTARPNNPQFLTGSNSVLKIMDSDMLASAFDMHPDQLKDVLESQPDAVILPGQVYKDV
eukprot:c24755_g1_i1 orf=186-1511(-)